MIGTDQRITSGPAATTAALRGRIHGCTRIVSRKVRFFSLAPRAPSIHGTTDERWSGPSRLLQEATLVAQSPGTLVDPNRTGRIGASACFGDSGGAVLRGGMLVGIITRATYPASSRACGYLTRWEALTLSAPVIASAAIVGERAVAEEPRDDQWQRSAPRPRVRQSFRGASNVYDFGAKW